MYWYTVSIDGEWFWLVVLTGDSGLCHETRNRFCEQREPWGNVWDVGGCGRGECGVSGKSPLAINTTLTAPHRSFLDAGFAVKLCVKSVAFIRTRNT